MRFCNGILVGRRPVNAVVRWTCSVINPPPKTPIQTQSKFKKALRFLKRSSASRPVTLGLLTLLVIAIVGFQSSETHNLRKEARKIQLGDEMTKVDAHLGGSIYGYESGWPTAGAPPTEFGAMYGGSMDTLPRKLRPIVRRTFRGVPSWYDRFFVQPPRAWPVLVQYNSDRLVTAVFVDGIEITQATSQRPKR